MDAADFAALGIMENSLNSDVELTRRTAEFEVSAFKWVMKILGYTIAFGTFFWPWISQTHAMQRFMGHDWSHPAAYEAGLRKRGDVAFFVIVAMIAMSLIYLWNAGSWFSGPTLAAINREDGLIEYVSALLLIIASGYALWVALRGDAPWGLRTFHGFLALLFFVMCGKRSAGGSGFWALRHQTPFRKSTCRQR